MTRILFSSRQKTPELFSEASQAQRAGTLAVLCLSEIR